MWRVDRWGSCTRTQSHRQAQLPSITDSIYIRALCCAGIFVYLYCFYYFFFRSEMHGFMQTAFYFGYNFCICYGARTSVCS